MTSVVLILLAAAPSPRVTVVVRAEPDCLSEVELSGALREAGVQVDGVRLEPGNRVPETLLLDAAGQVLSRRFLEVGPEECEALPATVALLVGSWTGPLELSLPAPLASPQAPPSAATSVELSGLVGAGAVLASATPVGALELRGEWGVGERWGLGVQLVVETARRYELGPGRVDLAKQAAGVHGRVALRSARAGGPELRAGLRLDRIIAQTQGFSRDQGTTLYAPALWGEASWRWRLGERWFLCAGLGASTRLQHERVAVENVERAATLSPAELSGFSGVGWRFF